jgi:hypothetical protein
MQEMVDTIEKEKSLIECEMEQIKKEYGTWK